MANMAKTITYVPVDTQEEAINYMKDKHKKGGALTTTVVLDDKYVLSLPTQSKADYCFIKTQTNSANQLISKMKLTDRLRRKLEERQSRQ